MSRAMNLPSSCSAICHGLVGRGVELFSIALLILISSTVFINWRWVAYRVSDRVSLCYVALSVRLIN